MRIRCLRKVIAILSIIYVVWIAKICYTVVDAMPVSRVDIGPVQKKAITVTGKPFCYVKNVVREVEGRTT